MPVGIKDTDYEKGEKLFATSGVRNIITAVAYEVAKERERIAQMVERADNTMMKQDKLAAHIRNSP